MRRLASLSLLGFTFLLSFPLCPLIQPPGYDREVYRYIGMLLWNGGVPYKDVFDHRPPVFYFVTALGHWLGPWGLWLIASLCVGLAAVYFYRTLSRTGVSFAWVGPTIFILLMRSAPLIEGGGGVREFSASMLLILFCRAFQKRSLDWVQGFLIGLLFMNQPNDILPFFPAFLYLLFVSRNRIRSSFIQFGLGSLIVPAAVALYLTVTGAWSEFLFAAFKFNMQYYRTERTLAAIWENFSAVYYATGLWGATKVLILVAGWFFFRRRKEWKTLLVPTLVFLTCFVLQCFSSVGSGRFYPYYFLTIVPFLAMAFSLTASDLIQSMRRPWVMAAIAGGLVVFAASSAKFDPDWKHIEEYKKRDGRAYDLFQQYFDQVRDVAGQRGQIYVMNNPQALVLNTDLNVIAPSRWVYVHFWRIITNGWDPEGKMLDEIIEGLEANKTKYILDPTRGERPLPEPFQQRWNTYVSAHYDLKMKGADNELYVRRP